MDVERTIEFILQSQAKAEVRMDRMEARIDRMELRFDKRLNGLTNIMRTGMKMLNQLAAAQKELAAAQKRTERTLNSFIDSIRKGTNGRRRT